MVPNMAKSAGTLIALGADRIVMGYCSELGPIDPQIRIVVSNSPQLVSAWTFIRARDVLIERVTDARRNMKIRQRICNSWRRLTPSSLHIATS